MTLPEGPHVDALGAALAAEAEGQRALLGGNAAQARPRLRRAVDEYRRSWELAPPASFGRLIGMLKAAVIAGDARVEAAYARAQLPSEPPSPAAAYALAIAALVQGDDARAERAAAAMAAGSPAFVRAAEAVGALARRDPAAYAAAVRAIVDDFEHREHHLTGVAIADTALMLQRLAHARGMACPLRSELLPAGDPAGPSR